MSAEEQPLPELEVEADVELDAEPAAAPRPAAKFPAPPPTVSAPPALKFPAPPPSVQSSASPPSLKFPAPPPSVQAAAPPGLKLPAPPPVFSAPTPVVSAPAPTPVFSAPTPVVSAPAPTPVFSAPTPVVSPPAPTPVFSAPAPTPVFSAPALTPVVSAPAPASVLDALAPVVDAPAPAPASVLDALALVVEAPAPPPVLDVPLAVSQAAPTDTPTRMSGSNSSSFSHPPAPAPATIHEGEVLADRYRVHHRLGKGGMGEVYLAEHMDIGRKVAIKTLNAHLQDKPEIAERFMQEARTSSRVRHSNIVDITDFGKTDHGAPFFVMEYLEGEDLKSVLKRERVLPWERARDIILQVCAALAAAHAHGLVHRDLKPDNIYLIRQGEQELVKVLDFGIAKIISEAGDEMTQTGVLLGTPEYMSPEQAQDEPLDGRSDIYAMGVLMFRMFTGRLPFRAKAFMAVLGMHMQQPPPRPSEVDPNHPVSERQEAIILRCLAKKPEDRFQSADELAAAIRAIDAAGAFDIHFEMVQAPPPRRILGPALAAVGLAAVVGLGVFLAVRPPAPQDMPDGPAPSLAAAPAEPPASAVEPTIATPPKAPLEPTTPVAQPVPEDTSAPAGEPEAASNKAARKVKETREPKQSAVAKATPPKAPLAALGDAEIKAAAAGLSGALVACSELGIPGTTYKVDVEVGTNGKVTSATAHKPARGSDLGNCVEQAAQRARFPALASPQKATLALRL
ncbi:serine/threonine protein kinase [Nannocystis punicea]|uniref:Protein kinase n=1 Tax=Nannocystis punicea TaxID=2995304 RepID=A0ABY7H9N9_9BACT|nr:serine/threonine protein kinase [Nannocystis poenicansa]WAS95853.1 protein kinase [Nannocystis poenicansa]